MCFATIFCLRCGLNERTPAYIKDMVAYKEGDGLFVYFILADSSGAMTTSDGKVTLTITWTLHEFVEVELYSKTFTVQKTDFQRAKVGIGAFEHEVIAYTIGRIPYSSFAGKSKKEFDYFVERGLAGSGEVKVEFQRPDGVILKGNETIYF